MKNLETFRKRRAFVKRQAIKDLGNHIHDFYSSFPRFSRSDVRVKEAIIANTIGNANFIFKKESTAPLIPSESLDWTMKVLNQPLKNQLAFIAQNPPRFAQRVGMYHFKPL